MKKITLATLAESTEQEVFDHVATHLLKQGEQSLCGSACAYRDTENNNSCAAGCLMSDIEYHPDMEGNVWGGLVSSGKVPGEHCELISSLQRLHDCARPDRWRDALKELALEYDFEWRIK